MSSVTGIGTATRALPCHGGGTAHAERSTPAIALPKSRAVCVGHDPLSLQARGAAPPLLAGLHAPVGIAARAALPVVGRMSVVDLASRRHEAATAVQVGSRRFEMTVSVDVDWDRHLTVWPEGQPGAALTRSFHELSAGLSLEFNSGSLSIRRAGDALQFGGSDGARASVAAEALFDRLYERSAQITFGGLITYAVIRNTDAKTGALGVMLLRRSDEHVYYFSMRTDAELSGGPRWVVSINGTRYGMMLDGEELLFVSRPSEAN